jgi:cation transport regulator
MAVWFHVKRTLAICDSATHLFQAYIVRGKDERATVRTGQAWPYPAVAKRRQAMPYQKTADLPASVRAHLPAHAQQIFLNAYNNAWDQYAAPSQRRGAESQEESAFRVAWAAVKRDYQTNDATGQWEPKGSYGATEEEVSRDDTIIAPTFSDTEPGAGPNYGAAGDPTAPDWGGIADQTTLGPDSVRPPEQRPV